MLTPPLNLRCIEYRKRFEGNSYTKPLFVIAEDDDGNKHPVVMKLRHPDAPSGRGHYEGTSLACELICAMLARAMGLKVPEYAVVELRSDVERSISNDEIRALLRRNVGTNFGTIYRGGTTQWVPRALSSESPLMPALENVLVFDSTVINGDRKAEKSNLLWDGNDVFLIDHSVALIAHRWSQEQINDSPLFPAEQVQEHCSFPTIYGHGLDFTDLLTVWRNTLPQGVIDELRSFIPARWEHREGDLDRIFTFLSLRPSKFDATSEHLRSVVQ
jgi:hypothetical protein